MGDLGEQPMPVTVTFDLEDSRSSPSQEPRFAAMSERFLEFIEGRGITATVFIVGELARSHPELVGRVAAGGHEVGLHGLRHLALADVGRERLESQLREGRALLEDAAGVQVRGFRAPIFSLTPSTEWAVEKIAAAGFEYSSSVLPAANPLHGWPGAPRQPCRWPGGLLELPCPVGGVGRALVPFLGGIYLRFVPGALARRFLRQLPPEAVAWSYVHPYDVDPDEPFFVMPHAGWLTSRIVHMRRAATLRCLEDRIAAGGGAGPPLGELARRLAGAELVPIGSG
jgi:polysaccharide deacetylase family protein (PEP-CTERM system associated)